jgi:hypothetical protein
MQSKICRECNASFKTSTSAVYCGSDCREQRRLANQSTPEARHVILLRTLQRERVPRLDLLWSFEFYAALIADGSCAFCDGRLSPSGHALDRIVNSMGHRCYNVAACCSDCNEWKGANTTFEEMLLLRPGLIAVRKKRDENEVSKK